MDKVSLRKMSPVTYGLERLFFYLQYLSPANIFFRTRTEHQAGMDPMSDQARQDATAWRARRIEGYLIAWLILETILVATAPVLRGPWRLVLAVIWFRVFEV